NTRVIIVNVDNRVTGFIVDSVSEILKVQSGIIEPAPDIVTAGMDSQDIQGVCDIQGELVTLLDFSRILRVDEIRKLKTISKIAGDEGRLKVAAED
ncbi:MAG: chemotaxis protein CheW, partial [Desulfosarcina sp.]|nr:chemotaxis protein CheW [Desulfobacterales bacterium]